MKTFCREAETTLDRVEQSRAEQGCNTFTRETFPLQSSPLSGGAEQNCNNFAGEAVSFWSRADTLGKVSLKQGCKVLCLL